MPHTGYQRRPCDPTGVKKQRSFHGRAQGKARSSGESRERRTGPVVRGSPDRSAHTFAVQTQGKKERVGPSNSKDESERTLGTWPPTDSRRHSLRNGQCKNRIPAGFWSQVHTCTAHGLSLFRPQPPPPHEATASVLIKMEILSTSFLLPTHAHISPVWPLFPGLSAPGHLKSSGKDRGGQFCTVLNTASRETHHR